MRSQSAGSGGGFGRKKLKRSALTTRTRSQNHAAGGGSGCRSAGGTAFDKGGGKGYYFVVTFPLYFSSIHWQYWSFQCA